MINRELFNPDDEDRKFKIAQTAMSEDGRWMARVANAPLVGGKFESGVTHKLTVVALVVEMVELLGLQTLAVVAVVAELEIL